MVIEHSYLIIGGATKAGSTSLYRYLSDHPQICASRPKETRFFLDANYPLFARYRLEDGLDKYDFYFSHCQRDVIRMEASPQYLFSPNSARKIRESLPNVKLIFILRDPIDRLISYYRFGKMQGALPARITFEEYVDRQFAEDDESKECWLILKQGKYSRFLRPYFDLFDPDDILILKFERLKRAPGDLLRGVCRFANIAPDFYQDYSFSVFNQSQATKWVGLELAYQKVRRSFSDRLYGIPPVWRALRAAHIRFREVYLRLNRKPAAPIAIPDSVRARLEEYYRGEVDALAYLLKEENFSWD